MKITNEIKKVFELACRSETTVLITGATGTGKSSIARKIHENSPRKDGPFVVVNLASLHEGTLESELFGHEKGSFTGADRKRIGKLVLGHGGTVFLDEVGELPLKFQARLLEFLQSKTLTPVGGNHSVALDVRIIVATHKNLRSAVQRGEFRADLYHRLCVLSLHLSSLQERMGDLDGLVHSCLSEVSLKNGKFIKGISAGVAERLENYSWPGNIRELRNALEYAVMAAETSEVTLHDLPDWLFHEDRIGEAEKLTLKPGFGVAEVTFGYSYQETFERLEKDYLKRALARNRGRISRTARQIGMNKTTLLRRVRAYRLLEAHEEVMMGGGGSTPLATAPTPK